MDHAVFTRNLGRSRSWRAATVQSLAQALIRHERIETTLAKAKETQRLTEKLVTLGKKGSLTARRQSISLLGSPELVRRLFTEISPRFAQRPGGYTRILHDGYRPGDGASMALIEFVELSPRLKEDKTKKEKGPKKKEVPPPSFEEKSKMSEPKEKKKPDEPSSGGGFMEGLRKFFKDRPK